MIEILERKKAAKFLYTCSQGDTLDTIALKFGTTVQEIRDSNPLFCGVYPGCMLCLCNVGKKRITVQPLQTLAMIANEHNVRVEAIMKQNNLKSERVFVGMQLLIEEE